MNYKEHFEEEFQNKETNYFIFDTKGGSQYGDIDFIQYQWDAARYNLVKEGDLFLYRRPGKSSATKKFFFFGAGKIDEINGEKRLTGDIIKPYPFQDYLHAEDLSEYKWNWKERKGNTWMYFFNQYGMNKINKEDFINLLELSESSIELNGYDTAAATHAIQDMQKRNYTVEDREIKTKVRSKQQVFSNEVKANYGNKCAICSINTRDFLIGSHIIPWSQNKETRLDPANGICLCSFHDKAFDKGYLTIDDNYKIEITELIGNDTILKEALAEHSGKKIKLPQKAHPNKEYLIYHREHIFKQ